jgi:N-acetylneuraminic acid mutarotase
MKHLPHKGPRAVAAVVLATLALAACSSKNAAGPTQQAGPSGTFTGTLVGGSLSGVLTLNFPASVSAVVASRARFTVVPVAEASTVAAAATSVTGSLAVTGGSTYTLSGTYDPSANPQLSVSGSGYTITGSYSAANGQFSGSFAAPGGVSGQWTVSAGGAAVKVFCGSYGGTTNSVPVGGTFNLVLDGSNRLTGLSTTADGKTVGLTGTYNSATGSVSLTSPNDASFGATGAVNANGSGGGAWSNSKGSGTWAASTTGCSSPGTWTSKASMPTATGWPAPTAGVINGILYVAGGTSVTGAGTALATLQAYDPVSNTWTTKASMSTGREGPAAGVINGVLYVAGGVGSGGIGHADGIAALEAYDPATDTWTSKAPMPTARAGGAAGVINGILFVVGGTSSSVTGGYADVNSVEAYNPTTNTWATKAPMPTAGFRMASAVINGILYVAGFNAASTTVEAYDPATDTWTTEAPMRTPRAGPTAGVINGILYVVGGFPAYPAVVTALATVEAYNPATNTWATKALMPTPRGTPAGGVINGVLYVAGGGTDTGNGVGTVEAFTP